MSSVSSCTRWPPSLGSDHQQCPEEEEAAAGSRPSSSSSPGGRHGQAEQQAEAGGPGGPAAEHGVLGCGDPGVVQGLPQGLPQRAPVHRGVQEDLRQLLPLRGRVQVCRARVPHLRRQRGRHHRLPRVPVCAQCDVARPPGAEAQVGLQHVRPGRQRLHLATGDARDSHGHLQDGGVGDEDARRRVDAREAHGQDFSPDGQEHGRQTLPGGVYRGRQERPLHCAATPVRPSVLTLTSRDL